MFGKLVCIAAIIYAGVSILPTFAHAQAVSEKEAAYQAFVILSLYESKCGEKLSPKQIRTLNYIQKEFNLQSDSPRIQEIVTQIAKSGEMKNLRSWCSTVEKKFE